ncbi:MAG: hypothetical protein EOO62_07470, partial [Hymenobacter sp.]
MKSGITFWLVVALMLLAVYQNKRWNTERVFEWDAGGYFSYLPAIFLYHDPGRADSLARQVQQGIPEKERDIGHLGIRQLDNGRYLTKYPPGVAISQLPWFAGAHAYSHLKELPANGYFWPYQEAAMLAGVGYAILGLWVLRKLLRRYYPDAAVAWAIAGIGLGTNYFVYATHEAANAHAVLFLWQASLLYCTARWYETLQWRWSAGIGVFLGLAVLTRFSEAIYVLIPLAWGLTSVAALRQRPLLLARHAGQLGLAAGLSLALISVQFVFWRVVSGHWVVESYPGERFDFANPHIMEGLISMRRGWLVYTPLAALIVFGGIPLLRRYVPAALPAVLLLLPALIYVTFSWVQWWYGWGFSTRPFVSVYPLLALPLAAVLAASARRIKTRIAVRAFVSLCVALNLWQGWQYVNNILPGDEMTLEVYKERLFQVPPWDPATPTP